MKWFLKFQWLLLNAKLFHGLRRCEFHQVSIDPNGTPPPPMSYEEKYKLLYAILNGEHTPMAPLNDRQGMREVKSLPVDIDFAKKFVNCGEDGVYHDFYRIKLRRPIKSQLALGQIIESNNPLYQKDDIIRLEVMQ